MTEIDADLKIKKKILHLEIPINKSEKDLLLISAKLLNIFISQIQGSLGNDWIVITSPMKSSALTDDVFSNLKIDDVGLDELKRLLDKGNEK